MIPVKVKPEHQPVLDYAVCQSGIIHAGRPGTLWGLGLKGPKGSALLRIPTGHPGHPQNRFLRLDKV